MKNVQKSTLLIILLIIYVIYAIIKQVSIICLIIKF